MAATPTSIRHFNNSKAQQERRASMPTAAQTNSEQVSRSSSSHRAPVRQSSLSRGVSQASSSSDYDGISGRKTPQSAAYVGARPDSANAVSRRHVASPDTTIERRFAESPIFFDQDSDDEQDKGHGTRRQSSGPSSGRWTPTILSGIIRKTSSPIHAFNYAKQQNSPRFKVLHTEPDNLPDTDRETEERNSPTQGRKTPVRYRPSQESSGSKLGISLNQGYDQQSSDNHSTSQPYRGSHPLSHTHTLSSSTGSNSSHSIQMQSPLLQSHSRHTSISTIPHMASHSRHTSMHILPPAALQSMTGAGNSSATTANSSPIVVPQARRGAINLRPTGRSKRAALSRRRRAAAATAAKARKVSLPRQILQLLSAVIKALRYPSDTAQSFRLYVQATLHGIDMSFRDARTGQRVWRPSWLGAYIPLLIWLVVSLSSTFTVLIWHTQVFQALDRLSTHLQELGLTGRLFLGSLIFLTTFPPLPLYSTLIILCGFSFGLLQGFIISYIAALTGAIVVFLLSRSLLKGWMVELLNKSGGLKRVVRAIEKRPKLLFLVRLAPYPYNLMNTLLASSPTLTLRTYTLCTALALPKLLVHCALGTSIKNFAAYNGAGVEPRPPLGNKGSSNNSDKDGGPAQPMIGYDSTSDSSSSGSAEAVKHIFGFVGVGLCVGIFIYLLSVARKAVDEELDSDEEMDDYDIVLSDDEDDEVDNEGEGSDLDHDELNISRLSNESIKEGSNLFSGLTTIRGGAPSVSRDMTHSASDSTLLNGLTRPYSQAGETFTLSNLHRKGAHEIMTPNYVAPLQSNGGVSPYFASHGIVSSSNRSNRNMGSQVSMADSIVEMEKHAVEMEQAPLFSTSNVHVDDDIFYSEHDSNPARHLS